MTDPLRAQLIGLVGLVAVLAATDAQGWPWDDKYARARKCKELVADGSECAYRRETQAEAVARCHRSASEGPGSSGPLMDRIRDRICQTANPVCRPKDGERAWIVADTWWWFQKSEYDECKLFLVDFYKGRATE